MSRKSRYTYYYDLVKGIFQFLIPEKKSLLYYGYYSDNTILALNPSYAVCINEEGEPHDIPKKHPNVVFVHSYFHDYVPDRIFDYVILDVALGKSDDMCALMKNIEKACDNHTRIIIHQENYLWQGILRTMSKLGLKNKEKTKNWLSVEDIHTFLKSAGFEGTRTFNKNLCPVKLGFIGPLINFICAILPLFDFFKLDQFIVARFIGVQEANTIASGLTICITVKNEEGNIEGLTASLPVLSERQEIIYVEGHSTDNTVAEIKRMQELYPEKNIRLIHQNGKGQGDAILTGFKEARGDVIILYEGDNTSSPSDIQYFYDCIRKRHFEFIEGSRFSYPLMSESMPFINKLGNIFFARWFSLFLKERTTDVLSGIKAIAKKDFDAIANSWGFLGIEDPFGDFELLYGSARYGLKIGEIPIHYKPRIYGASKTNAFKHGFYLMKMAVRGYWIFRNPGVQTVKKNKHENTTVYSLDWAG